MLNCVEATDDKRPAHMDIGFVGKCKGKHDKWKGKCKHAAFSKGECNDQGCGKLMSRARMRTLGSPKARAQARMTSEEDKRPRSPVNAIRAASLVAKRSTGGSSRWRPQDATTASEN